MQESIEPDEEGVGTLEVGDRARGRRGLLMGEIKEVKERTLRVRAMTISTEMMARGIIAGEAFEVPL